MRAYFVGAHSTGKTTLARHTSKKYGIPLITEVARMLLAEKEIPIENLRYDIDAVNIYQKGVFSRQILEEGVREHFVSDRSFDNLAYACEYTSIFAELLKTEELKSYIDNLLKPDSMIFFIRPREEILAEDGTRERTTWDGVNRIDSHIKFMLEMWGLPHFSINTPCMQERIRLVGSVIDMYQRKSA